jgi:hypothetical protein
MTTLRIGFSKPKSFFPIFSWAIRLFEKTPYSHVFIRWQTSQGVMICYQASGAQINFMGPYAFNKHMTIVDEFEFNNIPDDSWDNLMRFCLNEVGKDYALLGVLFIPFVRLFKLKSNPFCRGENQQYCAELVTRALAHVGMKLDVDPDSVGLRDVYDFVRISASNFGGCKQ